MHVKIYFRDMNNVILLTLEQFEQAESRISQKVISTNLSYAIP